MKHLAKIALAATISFTVPVHADNLLIRSATVHTMAASGPMENTDVLVADGMVRRIGQNLDTPSDDYTVIEANGRVVTPGFFAGVTSIGIGEVSGVEESMDSTLDLPAMRPEFDVTPAFNPHSSLLAVTRIEGFSFTMLGAGGGTIIGGQGRIASLEGNYESFSGNHVLFIRLGGGAAGNAGGSRAGQWMMLEQAMDEASDPTASNEPGLLTRTGRRVLDQYADGGTVVFSVNRASDILQTIKFADAFGFKAVISGGAEAWMVAKQLADANVPVLLNPLQNLPSSFDALVSRQTLLRDRYLPENPDMPRAYIKP